MALLNFQRGINYTTKFCLVLPATTRRINSVQSPKAVVSSRQVMGSHFAKGKGEALKIQKSRKALLKGVMTPTHPIINDLKIIIKLN